MEIGGLDLVFDRPNVLNNQLIEVIKKVITSCWQDAILEFDEDFEVLDVYKNNEILEAWETDPSGFMSIYFGDKTITFVIDHENPDEPRKLVNQITEEFKCLK